MRELLKYVIITIIIYLINYMSIKYEGESLSIFEGMVVCILLYIMLDNAEKPKK